MPNISQKSVIFRVNWASQLELYISNVWGQNRANGEYYIGSGEVAKQDDLLK